MLSYKRFKTALIKKSFTYEQARELLSNKENWHLVYQLSKDNDLFPTISLDGGGNMIMTFGKYDPIFYQYFLRLPFGFTSIYNLSGLMYDFLDDTSNQYIAYSQMPAEEQHRLFGREVFDFRNPTMYTDSMTIRDTINERMQIDFPLETVFLVENVLYLGRDPSVMNNKVYCVTNQDASKPDVLIYAFEDEFVSSYGIPWESRFSLNQFSAPPAIPGSEASTTTVIQSHFFDNKIVKELPSNVIKYRDALGEIYTTLNVASIITANSRTLDEVLDTYIHGNGFHVLGSLSNGNAFVIRTTNFSTWSFHEQANSTEVLLAYGDANVLKMKQMRNTKIGEQIVNLRECYTLDGTTWNVLPDNATYFDREETLFMHGGDGKYYISMSGTTSHIFETTDFVTFKKLDAGFYNSGGLSSITPIHIETNTGVSVKGFNNDGDDMTLPSVWNGENYGNIDYYDAQEDVTVNPKCVILHDSQVLTIASSIDLGGL